MLRNLGNVWIVSDVLTCSSSCLNISIPDVESSEVSGDKVVEEEDILMVLDIQHDCRLAGGEVSVQADAVTGELE